jgi:hypothetical protein
VTLPEKRRQYIPFSIGSTYLDGVLNLGVVQSEIEDWWQHHSLKLITDGRDAL